MKEFEWKWYSRNKFGMWCLVCGNHLRTPSELDENYDPPECCDQCGAPDEIDPEKIG